MKGKRIVVTGGAGFIGSNLAEELYLDNEVVIVDDLSSGRLENISHLLQTRSVSFVQGSILDSTLLGKAFSGADCVFHHAAVVSVPKSVLDPLPANEVNILGTLNVLMAAQHCRVTRLVFASSCAVYGNTPGSFVAEEAPADPQSPYAVTKLAGEHYCHVFRQVHGLHTVCLRYYNVYGPRQDPHSDYAAVIPVFISRARQGQPLIIYGDGRQTRDFVFVKDVAHANITVAEGKAEGVYNIGTGVSISINMLADAVMTAIGKRLDVVHEEARSGEVLHSQADISKAKALGYKPTFDLPAGLQETARNQGKRWCQ